MIVVVLVFLAGYFFHKVECWLVHGEQLASFKVWRENGYLMPQLREDAKTRRGLAAPCPFCGKVPDQHEPYDAYRCGACCKNGGWMSLKDWNTRAR